MIKFISSTQVGAPVMCGQAGACIAILNACLINGFNVQPLLSIERKSSVATVKTSVAHGYQADDVVLISGAVDDRFNGDHRIQNVTTTTFDFDIDPSAPSTAQMTTPGSLVARISPLHWTQPFAQDQTVVYRSSSPQSPQPYLQIDEKPQFSGHSGGLRACQASLYESMSDVNQGSGRSQVFWRKSQNEIPVARPWFLVGNERCFWFCVSWSETYPNRYVPYFFGDVNSFKSGDGFAAMIAGYTDLGYDSGDPGNFNASDVMFPLGVINPVNSGIYLMRSHHQLGGSVMATLTVGPGPGGAIGMGNTSMPFPNPVDNGIYMTPVMIQEAPTGALRGLLPGMLCPLHFITINGLTTFDRFILDGVARKILVAQGIANYGNSRLAFDLTGPWLS